MNYAILLSLVCIWTPGLKVYYTCKTVEVEVEVEAIVIHMSAIWGHRTLPHTEGGNMNCALLKSLVSNMYMDSWLTIMQTKVDICLDEAI